MEVPTKVKDLVEHFKFNITSIKSSTYNEAQARREFIDPLFESLNWDVNNKSMYAEAYKDVVHEDSIKVEGATKAPDYGFRIGGTRKFFVEAKKPAVNVKEDATAAFQLRRYAWSAKLPLSILTNFEHIAVYDCRIKPEPTDKASTARIGLFSYEDFEGKWDEISGIFSRDAVLKGSFDKYADDNRKKRGTAEVDDAFLQDIERWREMLARNIALRNAGITVRDLNTAVQRIIDRIIFLRIAEDRSIEPYGRLNSIKEGKDVYDRVTQLFRQADSRYNSGLFHFKKGDGSAETLDTFTLGLTIDDKPLKKIISGLYYPESPYEFSVISADILGQVYEQFLGKVIRLSGRSILIEDKPEVKKAGGVYYTPTFVVQRIVEHVIAPLLEGKTPTQASGLDKRAKDPAPIRVLDPACGSGSFLIQAYQHLLDWYRDQYVKDGVAKDTLGRNPALYQVSKGDWRLTISERRRILLAHIYGVDIDPQAVEVTKLSLLLKVLEGESADAIARQMDMFHVRALPDLESNVKCGNSLVSPDFYDQFSIGLFDEEQVFRINAFDWNEFKFMKLQGGFDAVIGNPPYGATLVREEKAYFADKYKEQSYQLDSYLLFMERSLKRLMRAGGAFGMIIPNPWLTNLSQTALREFVIKNVSLTEIVHFHFPVFVRSKAVVDTEIVSFTKDVKKGNRFKAHFVTKTDPDGKIGSFSNVIEHAQSTWEARVGEAFNIFLDDNRAALAAKIKAAGRRLDEAFKVNVGMKPYQVGKGKPAQTRADVTGRVFDADRRINATYRQYLRGADIERFRVAPVKERYIRYGVWLAEPRPAAEFDADIKILVRQTGDSLVAAADDEQFLCMNNMHVLAPYEHETRVDMVLGILNSKMMNWYYHTLNPEMGEALAEVKKENVARLPIVALGGRNRATADKIEEAVARLIAGKTSIRAAKSEHARTIATRLADNAEAELNRLVYEIYGLTDEEVACIEQDETRFKPADA